MPASGPRSSARELRCIGIGLLGAFVLVIVALLQPWRSLGAPRSSSSSEPEQTATAALRHASGPRLLPMKGEPSLTERVRRLQGLVQTRERRSIRAAQVCILDVTADAANTSCVLTSASGRFALDASRFSQASIVASAPGFLPSRQALSALVSAPAVEEVILTLEEGGVVISGVVLDAMGGTIPGALISAHATGGGTPLALATSSGEGQFELAVPAGRVTLQARADAYSETRISVQAPQREVALVLAPASTIAGRVVSDREREPIAGAWVTASDAADPGVRACAQADGEGRFLLTGLTGGRYDVTAVAASWRAAPALVELGLAEAAADIVLTASRGTTLDGIVDVSGTPCAYGSLALDGPISTSQTIRDGTVHFDGLWAGRYLAMIACSTATPPSEDMTETIGAEDTFSVELEPVTRRFQLAKAHTEERGTGSIEVAILAPANDLLRYTASLALTDSMHAIHGRREGERFIFDGLRLGLYEAFLDQSPEIAVPVKLTPRAQHGAARLSAPTPALISGRVLDENGHPLPDAWVRAYHRDYRLPQLAAAGVPALTTSEGHFVLTGLFAGEYDLRVDSPLGQARFERVLGGNRDVELRVETWEPAPERTHPGTVVL